MLTLGDWLLVALFAVAAFAAAYFVTTDTVAAILGGVGGLIGGLVRAYFARRSWQR